MITQKISGGTVHALPDDVNKALKSNSKALKVWESLTPLARNEWICWIITVKQQQTRNKHINQALLKLQQGVRRPCCWIGCIHRKDKKISPSVQWVLSKNQKSASGNK